VEKEKQMKIMEYREKYSLEGSPLANNRYDEFLKDFVDEFDKSYSKISFSQKPEMYKRQLKTFVSDFRKKFDAIFADSIELDIYEEKYERLWKWFYANHVVPKFIVTKSEKDKDEGEQK
jgi:hypothetical protein